MAQVSNWELMVIVPCTIFISWWLSNNLNGGTYLAITFVFALIVWCWIKESSDKN
jgi:hypothetical protein